MPAPGPKTGEGLLPWPNKGDKGISQIRHLHTRHQGEVGAQMPSRGLLEERVEALG